MKLRSDYKDEFVSKHGVKLGLMSCFVKVPASIMCHLPIAGYLVHDYANPSTLAGCCFCTSKPANRQCCH